MNSLHSMPQDSDQLLLPQTTHDLVDLGLSTLLDWDYPSYINYPSPPQSERYEWSTYTSRDDPLSTSLNCIAPQVKASDWLHFKLAQQEEPKKKSSRKASKRKGKDTSCTKDVVKPIKIEDGDPKRYLCPFQDCRQRFVGF